MLGLDESIQLEPMLSAMAAAFSLCNFLGRRREFGALIERSMHPVMTFFFISTGMDMNLAALQKSWPIALGLFAARLISLRLGCEVGAVWAGASKEVRQLSWLAFITQAGVGLGLTEQIGEKFPSWGLTLESSLVGVIVLNQLVGPPLLSYALRQAKEAGKTSSAAESDKLVAQDRLVDRLADRIANPTSLTALVSAATAAAAALVGSTSSLAALKKNKSAMEVSETERAGLQARSVCRSWLGEGWDLRGGGLRWGAMRGGVARWGGTGWGGIAGWGVRWSHHCGRREGLWGRWWLGRGREVSPEAGEEVLSAPHQNLAGGGEAMPLKPTLERAVMGPSGPWWVLSGLGGATRARPSTGGSRGIRSSSPQLAPDTARPSAYAYGRGSLCRSYQAPASRRRWCWWLGGRRGIGSWRRGRLVVGAQHRQASATGQPRRQLTCRPSGGHDVAGPPLTERNVTPT